MTAYNTPMPEKPNFNHIAIASHSKIEVARSIATKIAAFLQAHGIQTTEGVLEDSAIQTGITTGDFDLFIALGGDGTILRSGQLCAPANLPILGINFGHLGFLTELPNDAWQQGLEKLLSGDYWLENRMMLKATLLQEGNIMGSWDIVNEVMVGRGEIMRPVRLTTYVDDLFLTTYLCDGVLASTPTGSTAYAMAAGGPILPPGLRNILMVPVAPHMSFDRAIVLAEGSTIRIQVNTDHQAALSVDGQLPTPLKDNDQVIIGANRHSVELIRMQDPGYFYRNLTSKLNHNMLTETPS